MDDVVNVPDWLMSVWTNALADAVASMTSRRPAVTWQPESNSGVIESEPVWQEVSFNIVSAGPAGWLGASVADSRGLGALLLIEAGVDDADESLQEDTYSEVVNQAFSVLARALTERLGKEVLAKPLAPAPQAPSQEIGRFSVVITHDDTPAIRSLLCFNQSFVAALEAALGAPVEQPADSRAEQRNAAIDNTEPKGILALLLKIDLSVRIALARTLLPVSDVLRLTTGAIVELHQPIEDPAELIVNDHLLARGRIVVIGGSYGFEVTDLLDRGQMVRLLAFRGDTQRVPRATNHVYES